MINEWDDNGSAQKLYEIHTRCVFKFACILKKASKQTNKQANYIECNMIENDIEWYEICFHFSTSSECRNHIANGNFVEISIRLSSVHGSIRTIAVGVAASDPKND